VETIALALPSSAEEGIVVIPDSEIYLDPLQALTVKASFRRSDTELRVFL
jgi:hypothetical protein